MGGASAPPWNLDEGAEPDPSTGKLVINVEDGTSGIMAEAANASDQSTVVDVQFIAFGE